MNQPKVLRIAILGTGAIGQRHAAVSAREGARTLTVINAIKSAAALASPQNTQPLQERLHA